MRIHNYKATLKAAVKVAGLLFFGAVAAFGQQQINLTAAPTTATLPTGATVPMWGYFCGTAVATNAAPSATCAALNPASVSTTVGVPSTWSPVVITVPAGQYLQINLTNNLSFQPPTPTGGSAPAANNIPTSITILGQLGGGLGVLAQRTTTPSPSHECTAASAPGICTQDTVTWSTVGGAPAFTPPPQGPRVQSFGTEVQATPATTAQTPTALTFGTAANPLRPGTYLIESGTHPSIQGPMGLYGILVVTCPPGATCTGAGNVAGMGQAYPQNMNGGVLNAAVNYNAEVPLVFGEIDPVQNNSVNTAVNTAAFSETMVWSGQPGGCGNPSSTTYNQCYPPAVNYTPLYYLINGVAFNKTNPSASLFSVTPNAVTAGTGEILLRFVNAGLRMHVPAILGAQTTGFSGAGAPNTLVNGFSLVAEDGNPLPGVPKVQNEFLAVPGKVLDLMIYAPAAGSPAVTFYDRELSLSANGTGHDGGMLAYIGVNGSTLPTTGAFSAASTGVTARPDTYNALACPAAPATCAPLVVSDPIKGVIANDTNVYGVTLLTPPTAGTVTLNENGTFTYAPNAGTASDSFVYCANGSVSGTPAACSSGITATVTLGAEANKGGLTVHNRAYTANTASYFALKAPGVLGTQYDTTVPSLPDTDSAGYPLSVVTSPTPTFTGGTLLMDAEGGFTATVPPCATAAGCVYNFTYTAQNTEGQTGTGNVQITFPAASNLSVTVLDGYDHTTQITDYRWLIEEDRTFYNDPNCTTNVGATGTVPAGCPSVGTNGAPIILGANFHTSNMPYVAIGCTGPLSCEQGQMMIDNRPACNAGSTTVPAGCSATAGTPIFAICDVGDGVCRPDPNQTTGTGKTSVMPSSVHLDPSKRYYISVLPGDAAAPFAAGYGGVPCGQPGADPATCSIGHGMGGGPIAAACGGSTGVTCTATTAFAPVTILSQPSPYPTAKLSVFVFEDDFPLNGEHDSSGGTGAVNTANEPGLGQFQIQMFDAFGASGDFTGQMGFDMFNQPLSNGLAGTIDPSTGQDACPITKNARNDGNGATDPTATGITGMIVTCPEFEADGVNPSPLAGQAVVEGLMQGRWGVIAHPGADRIARGEEWLQTNTLDGQKAHDAFTKIGEPSYFQEFGPASFHVSIGFANPAIINARHAGVCAGTDPNFPAGAISCNNTLKGRVVGERLSRTPDERLYGSGSHDAFAWTQCYVSFGDPDGEDFAFTKCDADGNWTLMNLPDGDWRVTTFDQWNDELVDGLSTPVRLGSATNASCAGAGSSASTCNLGDIATTQWEANLQTKTFIDDNHDGIYQPTETGIPFANVAVRLRDGELANWLTADFTGTANYNETFPLFSWYVVETDVTRYKNTGTHVVYDVGGPADGSPSCGTVGYPPCGTSAIAKNLANTAEKISLPTELRVPGAIYCAVADCTGKDMSGLSGASSTTSDPPSVCTTATSAPFATTCSTTLSSGRIDPPYVGMEGWQGFTGQFNFIEFGKAPYYDGENGGIHGHVEYASTRPFDDPQLLVQVQWTPLVPNVTINLYQEGVAADNVTKTLTLVDTTKTSSFDAWAQGFRHDQNGNLIASAGGGFVPNISCPGQAAASGVTPDLFFFTLYDQPNYLDYYNSQHGGPGVTALPYHSQFKCYDGMHNWNQIEPAPYDGAYSFPSVTTTDATGRPAGPHGTAVGPTGMAGTNCTICIPDPVPASGVEADPLHSGLPMLPPGKYVVEIVLPPGYELVKEEDKNILIGDNYIAPVTQQFGGLGNVFIVPDQASVAAAAGYPGPAYNANNPQQPTVSLGTTPSNNIVPSFIPEPTWPCVGEARVVPQFISLFPQTQQVSPFAGATRNLCDKKEVTLADKMGAIAKFFVYTSTHIAAKFNGGITDDYTSEFDPFSPTFGEKFSPPDMPVSIKDWAGNEISRVYADHFGSYNGMVVSSWEVNPPNPTGYGPGMSTFCMNDPGPVLDWRTQIMGPAGTLIANPNHNKMVTDPLFTQGYSQFCYELPFMPGTTDYLDTPVVPTSAFAGVGYNNVDCAYPDATPAVAEVDGDGFGPWVSASGNTLTIHALGDQMVPNYAYAGPQATVAPYNQKQIRRHYGFGNQAPAAGAGGPSGSVTIGGVPATINSWSDTQIVVTVPGGVPPCPVQQQSIYGGSTAQCGQLVINTVATRSGGQVTGVSITPPPATNRGGTYTCTPAPCTPTAPTVTFNNGGTGGTGAAATAVLGSPTGGVGSVTVNTYGAGYSSAPSVVFNNGVAPTGGTLATATAIMRRGVASVTVTNGGRYSATIPTTITATFSAAGGAAGGVTATGTAVTASDVVFNVTVNTAGSGYPGTTTASFTGGGCTTEPTAGAISRNGAGGITAVAIATPGIGCTGAPVVSFTPAHPTGATLATATAQLGRRVASVTITNPGSYALAANPTVSFSPTGAGGGVPATGSVTTTEEVGSVTVNTAGTGYTSAPAVSFTGGGTPTTGATATAVLTTSRTATVVSVTITNGGTGYTSAPTVTFSGSTATRAIGTATINGPVQTISGMQSIDTVTVTIGGKGPTHVAPSASVQAAIDAAVPGDMLIIDPTCTTIATGASATCSTGAISGTTPTQAVAQTAHNELLIMWKPVRLQGTAAATSVINANPHPAGKMDAWRQKVDCLFGLGLNGAPISTAATAAAGGANAAPNPFDPTGQTFCDAQHMGPGFAAFDESGTNGSPNNATVDRFPLEATVGWNADLNGNLAELLQEPSLMGALEGAGITVLAKGVAFPSDPYNLSLLAGFPTGTTLLQNTLSNPNGAMCLDASGTTNPFPSNYMCNPSSIDGLGITDSSQGGGGIFVHGWAHNIQIGNNRIYNNAGTLSGGINLGQGEFAPAQVQGAGLLNAPPGSCEESPVPNAILPYCENVNVNIHNNYVTLNSSTGDELFSATPAGAGGVSICTGSDYYKFNYNWVCGNLSSGDGGGVGHIGFSYNGDIEHNTIIFNQSTNPTIPANGGGLFISGTPDADILCNLVTNPNAIDQDCAGTGAPGAPATGPGATQNTPVSTVGPSDGSGPGLVVNANLIMGNSAESGTGAGIAFQAVNGSDIVSFPTDPGQWNSVRVTNNIIVDNVAGWDGGGISLYDSPNVNIINNTIAFNDSTGSAGMLFNTLGAPLSSQGGSGNGINGAPSPTSSACNNASNTATCPQIGGLAVLQHSAILRTSMPASGVTCPPGHFQTTSLNGTCTTFSYPKLENNVFWQNHSYYISVGGLSPQFQQNVVTLNNLGGGAVASQTTTGQCINTNNYWDIGVRGDTGPGNHSSTVTLTASDSVLTPGTSVLGSGNATGNPNFTATYCNGSRVPPEAATATAGNQSVGSVYGWNVPPGIADATVPNPIFNLQPAATVDEGNNWVNLRYGPLSMTNPTAIGGANGNFGGGLPLGNYAITSAASSAANRVTGGTNLADAPVYDFFGTVRGDPADAGAVEFVPAPGTPGGNAMFTVSPTTVDFGFVPVHSPTTLDQDIVVTNTGSVSLTLNNGTINCAGGLANCNPASFTIQGALAGGTGSTCAGATLAPGESCIINVVFNPTSTSHAVRNANLQITVGGVTQRVLLTGHDSFGTLTVAPPGSTTPAPGANNVTVTGTRTTTPTITPATPSTGAITGTITLTNTQNPCFTTVCPAGSNADAGPVLPTAITLTPTAGTGTWTIGGTCAVGTPINAGGTIPAAQGGPAAGSSCTITLTYTPPVGATGAALNGRATLVVTGYGIDPTQTFINATYNAN